MCYNKEISSAAVNVCDSVAVPNKLAQCFRWMNTVAQSLNPSRARNQVGSSDSDSSTSKCKSHSTCISMYVFSAFLFNGSHRQLLIGRSFETPKEQAFNTAVEQ